MAASLEVEDRELQRVLLESLADQQPITHNAIDDEALARALQEQEDSLLGYASPFRASGTTYTPSSPYTAPAPTPLRTSSSNNRPASTSTNSAPFSAPVTSQTGSSTSTLRTSGSNNRPLSTSASYTTTSSAPPSNTLRTSSSNNSIPSTTHFASSITAPPQSTTNSSGNGGSAGNPILVNDDYDSGSDDEITKSVLRLSQLEQTINDIDARIAGIKGAAPSSSVPPSTLPTITAHSPTVAAAMNAVQSATNATLAIPRTNSMSNVSNSNTATGSSNRFVAPPPPQDSADALSELLTKMSITPSNERAIRNNEKNNKSNRNQTEGASSTTTTTSTTTSTNNTNTNNTNITINVNNSSTIPTESNSSEPKQGSRHHSNPRDKGLRTTRVGGVRVRANGGTTSDSGITRRGEKSSDNRDEGDARRPTNSHSHRISHTTTSHSSTSSTSSTIPHTSTYTASSSNSAPRIPTTAAPFSSPPPIPSAAPLPNIPTYSNIMANTHTGTNSANPSRPPILYNYRPASNSVNNNHPPNNNVNTQHNSQTNMYSSNTTRITHSANDNSVNINISYGNGGVPPLHYVHTTNGAPRQENNNRQPNPPNNTQNSHETTDDEALAQRLQLQEALEAQREFDMMGPFNQMNALIGADENAAPWQYEGLFGGNRPAGVPAAAYYLDEEGSDYSDGEGGGDDVDNMTYEQLLALGERIGNVSVGASKNEIELCPKFTLKQELANNKTCLVCQDDMQVGNTLRRLPCLHTYHSDCIDMWLQQKPTCPVCLHTIKNE